MSIGARWKPVLLGLALLLGTATSSEAQRRRALLVGIDDYTAKTAPQAATDQLHSEVPRRPVWSNLGGAANDAGAFRDLLISKYGFQPEDVKVLINQEASREAILQGLREHLIAPVRKDDIALFFYAGHGSQVVNSRSGEPDRKDETIVPADSRLGARDIRDKELRLLFNEILDRGAQLTVILDTCHSGSGARGLLSRARARILPLDPRDVQDGTTGGPRPEERGALILSAARDDQVAREATDALGVARGAFSLALIEALGRSDTRTPVEHVFLRAKALLQTRWAGQEPVLAGDEVRRGQPLFGGGPHLPGGERLVAVRRMEPDGRILLQAGWAEGLTEGSVLALRAQAGEEARVRIVVTSVSGPAASEAKLAKPEETAGHSVAAGDLFQLIGWTVSAEPSLRVWIPEAGAHWGKIQRLARDLQARAVAAGVSWVHDPVIEHPTHVLSWEGEGWSLVKTTGEAELLGVGPTPREIIGRLAAAVPPVRLFVHIPASPELATRIRLGVGTPNTAVERTSGPENADYSLVGRWSNGEIEFAWIRPATSAENQDPLPLPSRTGWHLLRSDPVGVPSLAVPLALEDAALRIAKIRAWLTLEPPPGDDFPYDLLLKDAQGRAVAHGTPLPAGATYGLALVARSHELPRKITPRYIYVFTINSSGASVLLFPPSAQGNVENRVPVLFSGQAPPSEVLLGRQPSFRVAEPFGMDTYFLLTSEEPIPNPWVLEFEGVRARGPEGKTLLEELLSQRGATSRGAALVTPVTWSIKWQVFKSASPDSAQ